MTSRGGVRAAAWAAGVLLLAAGTAGCGLRDRSAAAGGAAAATSAVTDGAAGGAAGSAAAGSGSGAAGGGAASGGAGPAGGATTKPAPAGPALSPAQVAQVEAVVGAASKAVAQGEAEVASDG